MLLGNSPRTLLTRTIALGSALLVMLAGHAAAEPAATSRLRWVTNGSVHAATVSGQTLFIGGSFTRVAPPQNLLGPWFAVSATSGAAQPALPATDAPVYAIEPDGAGGYFVGGGFTQIGGVPRTAIAHVLPDGRVDAQFTVPLLAPPGYGPPNVYTLARSGGVLYVGGTFVLAAVPGSSGLIALETGSGAVRPWHPGVTTTVAKIIPTASRVFVLGDSTVWSLDPVTAATQWTRPLVNGWLSDAALAGGRLLVAGPFEAGTDGRGVVSLDPTTGVVDPLWGPEWPMLPSHPQLNAIAVIGSTVFVGGSFSEVDGQPRANAAALDLVTGALTAWAPQVEGTVRDILPAPGGAVHVAGSFRRVNGQTRDGLARVDAAGALTAWSADAYSTDVLALAVDGDTLLAAGSVAVAGGVRRENLAAFALDTDTVLPWAPTMPHVVTDLASHGARVFAGLAHRAPVVLPAGQTSVVAFDALSGQPATWAPPTTEPWDPWDLVGLVDGQVYLSSGFGRRFVRVDAQTGVVDPVWRVVACCNTPRMFPAGDLIYLTGAYFTVDDTTRLYVAAVNRHTGAFTAWDARALVPPREGWLTVDGLGVVGQSMYLNVSTAGLLGLDLDTGRQITPFSLYPTHDAGILGVADGWLLVTSQAPGTARVEIRAHRSDGVLSTWNPNLRPANRWDFSTFAQVRVLTTDTDVIITNVTGGNGAIVHGVAVLPRQPSAFPTTLDAVTHSNVVRLSWTASSPPAASYIIEAGSQPGRTDLASFRTGTTATSLTALAAPGTYFVRVRTDPPGPPSNEIALDVSGCSGVASPPTRLVAAISGSTVTLTWTASPELVASYTLEAGSRDGAADLARVVIPGDRTTFSAEAPPGTYFVRVRADTSCGLSGPTPDVWFAVGQGRCRQPPTGLAVTGTSPLHTATWQPVANAYYVLEVGGAPGLADVARVVTTGTSVGPAAVPPGATFYLRVRAIGAAGMGPPSQEVVLQTR
nr:hypothetical protein FLJDLJJJ_00029 [uncultured bacterium]